MKRCLAGSKISRPHLFTRPRRALGRPLIKEAGGYMIKDENQGVLGGIVGDRIFISPELTKEEKAAGKTREASSFSLKTVRTMHGVDGDRIDKFDWHTVVSNAHDLVKRLRPGMRVRAVGPISTTRAKSAIIAVELELDDGERWPDNRRRRRSA